MSTGVSISNKFDKNIAVNFSSARPKIGRTAKLVLKLLNDCLKQNKVLDEYTLQEWWLENIIKPRNRVVDDKYLGKNEQGHNVYEKVSELEYYKRRVEKYDGLMPSYYWNDAKQKLKYHIGSLVVSGYLVAIPVISLQEDITPTEQNN